MKRYLTQFIVAASLVQPLMAAALLSSYTNFVTYDIATSEASGVTYNRDTGTLFAIGDEGEALYELSRTGQTLGTMTFDNSGNPDERTLYDPEGITYLGNGRFMIGTERNGVGWVTTYQAGTMVGKGVMPGFTFTGVGNANQGLEGVAFDPITGSVWGVKQHTPVSIYQLSNFAGGGQSVTTQPFANRRFTNAGITNLSDIYVMAASAAFAENDPRRMNILLLDRYTKTIWEMTREGEVVDQLDFSFLGRNAVEGITMDDNGVIYLVSEGESLGGKSGSGLHVLTSVPEPSAMALGLIGSFLLIRRRR